jgi:hypothetical protein
MKHAQAKSQQLGSKSTGLLTTSNKGKKSTPKNTMLNLANLQASL